MNQIGGKITIDNLGIIGWEATLKNNMVEPSRAVYRGQI